LRQAARGRTGTAAAVVLIVCTIVYVGLGLAVSHRPPVGVDALARDIAGEAPAIAWIFTASCLWPTLTTLGVIGCAAAIAFPAWRARIVFAIGTTLVAWQTSDALKNVFTRPRPTYWHVYHETSYAYSSGHALFATLVYWLWAYHAARSALPPFVRATLAALLAAWGSAVIWSRLALGAHYPSDLAGGVILAVGMLALARLVANAIAPRARVL
jgi:undecaprenyl-diphosphatase